MPAPPLLATKERRNLLPPDLVEILDACYMDIGLLAKTFFPDWFRAPYTKLHQEMIDGINESFARMEWLKARGKRPFVKFVAKGPRGVSKSGFVQLAVPARRMLYQESNFIASTTKSLGNTLLFTEDLRRRLVTSELLAPVVGDVTSSDDPRFKDSFNKEGFLVNVRGHRCFYLPRGVEQPIRGVNVGGFRLQDGIFDDFESVEMLFNDELRRKAHNWFWSDPFEAVSQFAADMPDTYFWMVGNCTHEDCFIENMFRQEGDDWVKVHISVCDENYNTYDPAFITNEQIQEERAFHTKNGTLDIWVREKMAKPGAPENAPFKRESFRYYDEAAQWPNYPKDHDLQTWMILDLATTITAKSDYSVICTLTMDFTDPAIFLRNIIIDRMDEEELVINALQEAIRWNINALGIEVTGQQAFAGNLFKKILTVPGLISVAPVELSAVAGKGELKGEGPGKIARIKSMAPYFKWGIVYFNRDATSLSRLEDQLVNFPKAAKKDGPDAMAYFQQMATKLGEEFINPIEAMNKAIAGLTPNMHVKLVNEGGITRLVSRTPAEVLFVGDIYEAAKLHAPPLEYDLDAEIYY